MLLPRASLLLAVGGGSFMARKRRSPVKYTGPLSKPIYVSFEYDVSSGLLGAITKDDARQQLEAKFGLLFEHYGIDPRAEDRWYRLSICLVHAHVPGMQLIYIEQPKPGRPRTWLAGRGDELVNEVDAIRKATGKRIDEAIAALREDRAKDWHKYTAQNLETRHREAKRRRKEQPTFPITFPIPIWAGVWESPVPGLPGLPGLFELLLKGTASRRGRARRGQRFPRTRRGNPR
jgi:hypothetical protein